MFLSKKSDYWDTSDERLDNMINVINTDTKLIQWQN